MTYESYSGSCYFLRLGKGTEPYKSTEDAKGRFLFSQACGMLRTILVTAAVLAHASSCAAFSSPLLTGLRTGSQRREALSLRMAEDKSVMNRREAMLAAPAFVAGAALVAAPAPVPNPISFFGTISSFHESHRTFAKSRLLRVLRQLSPSADPPAVLSPCNNRARLRTVPSRSPSFRTRMTHSSRTSTRYFFLRTPRDVRY